MKTPKIPLDDRQPRRVRLSRPKLSKLEREAEEYERRRTMTPMRKAGRRHAKV